MPFGYRIDPEKNLVDSTAFGVIFDADCFLCNRTLKGDERFDPAFRRIISPAGIQP